MSRVRVSEIEFASVRHQAARVRSSEALCSLTGEVLGCNYLACGGLVNDCQRLGERHRSQMLSEGVVDFDRLVEAESSSADFALHQTAGAPYGLDHRRTAVRDLYPFVVDNELAGRTNMEMKTRHLLAPRHKGGSAFGLSAAKAQGLLGDSLVIRLSAGSS
jgi:hypothetical protein